MFCLPCVFFGKKYGHNSAKLRKLFTQPFTRWNGASKRWSDHQTSSDIHKQAVSSMHTFLGQMEGKEKRINEIVNEGMRKKIKENRETLIPILKTVVLCGQQNISYGGDDVLSKHFETVPKNATYR